MPSDYHQATVGIVDTTTVRAWTVTLAYLRKRRWAAIRVITRRLRRPALVPHHPTLTDGKLPCLWVYGLRCILIRHR